jgi:PIN domain nuclease of toxin-antitoxin system
MRLLLDTNIVICMLDRAMDRLAPQMRDVIQAPHVELFVSVSSLWEAAIKERIGKLRMKAAVAEWPQLFEDWGLNLLAISYHHVLAPIQPTPEIRDPFDRILLGICVAEGLQLITLDRLLSEHPFAWRSVPAVKK